MLALKYEKVSVALMLCLSSPTWACTESGAFGFHFGDPLPAEARRIDGGKFGLQHAETATAPDPFPNFFKYSLSYGNRTDDIYDIEANRRIANDPLLSAEHAPSERERIRDAGRAEVNALVQAFGAQYGYTYERVVRGDNDATWHWEARTPTHVSRIGMHGLTWLYIGCRQVQRPPDSLLY